MTQFFQTSSLSDKSTAKRSQADTLWHSPPGMGTIAKDALRSEDHCIEIINDLFPIAGGHCLTARNTDCAELAMPSGVVLSTDCFIEDVHFRVRYFSPEETGTKAVTIALSDLAACGAVPLGLSLGLIIPSWLGITDLTAILRGISTVANKHNAVLTGGDITKGDRLGFCLTVWGASVAPEMARTKPFFLRRGVAMPGDALFLVSSKTELFGAGHSGSGFGDTGSGLARAGLQLLEQEGRGAIYNWPALCAAHLSPTALIRQGQVIANIGLRNPQFRIGLMDVSDGLVRDIPRLLETNTLKLPGANLTFDPARIAHTLCEYASETGQDAESLFLQGGEDYSLLGSCDPSLLEELTESLPNVLVLGTVEKEPGLRRFGAPLTPETVRGFDHFSPPAPQHVSPTNTTSVKAAPIAHNSPPQTHHALPPASGNNSVILTVNGLTTAQRLLHCCNKAWQTGLLAGFNGNISARMLPGMVIPCAQEAAPLPETCLITGTKVPKAVAGIDHLSLVILDTSVHMAGIPPSSESAMHTYIYRLCPQSNGIVHIHPPALLALSLKEPDANWLDLPLVEAQLHGKSMGRVEYFPAGSPELAEAVAELAPAKPAIWMKNHGLVTHGPSLEYALALAEELEHIARIALWNSMGKNGTPQPTSLKNSYFPLIRRRGV